MPTLATTIVPADDDAILEQAEGIVRDHCGWVIAPPETVTVTLESDGCYELPLPSRFVTDVVSVTHRGRTITEESGTTVGWRLTSEGLLVGTYFPTGPIVVQFTHGYAGDAVPPAVTRVVQAVAQRIKAKSGAGGVKSRQAGPFSESYGVELDAGEKADLAAYRQVVA